MSLVSIPTTRRWQQAANRRIQAAYRAVMESVQHSFGNSPWTITTESLVEMTITDVFLADDSFDVFDFGVLIGSTRSVATGGANCGLNPSICFFGSGNNHASTRVEKRASATSTR